YNWTAANKACPSGWHLPTDEEWQTLEMSLGMSETDAKSNDWRSSGTVGSKLKQSGTAHWSSPNAGANNSSGFTALPGGMLLTDYITLKNEANFYTSSTYRLLTLNFYYYRNLAYNNTGVKRSGSNVLSTAALSIRCIKD
ncbi:MAG: fibrobacter succinogenes major paralogous domain-containing protein, partial [Bacteroidales bacterium]